ncbi:hypothetical protein NL676_027828 [Syzygium grande]|nr:hypothetical protein NL676_027828 [Syzygium grande]
MEKNETHGDAKLAVWCILEEAKTKTTTKTKSEAGRTEARVGAKRGGLIPAKRRLVKRMIWDCFVGCDCFA